MNQKFYLILTFLLILCLNCASAEDSTVIDKCGYFSRGYLDGHYSSIFIEYNTGTRYKVECDDYDTSRFCSPYLDKYICIKGKLNAKSNIEMISAKVDDSKIRTDVNSNDNCAIFIDKIATHQKYGRFGASKFFDFYLKINLESLDGHVIKVGFLSKWEDGDWREYTNLVTESFERSFDYFEFPKSFFDGPFTAVFYVETENRTRYWAKARVNDELQDFVLHRHTFDYLKGMFGLKWGVHDLQKTADFNTYFNPFECR